MDDSEVTINGLKINYKIFGNGTPFLILHGWGSNSDRWVAVAEKIAERGFKVIVPDMPGFGSSQLPPMSWGLDDYCVFVESLITLLNLDKFYLLGSSFGGAVATKYSLKHPEKIKKLFLVSAACVRKKTLKRKILAYFSKIIKKFSFLPFYSLFRKATYKFIIRNSDYPQTKGFLEDTYLNVIKEDLSESLSSIKTPTVIIWGDKDRATPVEHAYLINKKITNSKLVIIPGGTHYLRKEVPNVLSQKILENL